MTKDQATAKLSDATKQSRKVQKTVVRELVNAGYTVDDLLNIVFKIRVEENGEECEAIEKEIARQLPEQWKEFLARVNHLDDLLTTVYGRDDGSYPMEGRCNTQTERDTCEINQKARPETDDKQPGECMANRLPALGQIFSEFGKRSRRIKPG